MAPGRGWNLRPDRNSEKSPTHLRLSSDWRRVYSLYFGDHSFDAFLGDFLAGVFLSAGLFAAFLGHPP